MNNINKENNLLKEDRVKNNRVIKIKRLKTGMIIAIITGSLIIVGQSLSLVNQNWYFAARMRAYIDYENNLISYAEYNTKRNQLELDFYVNIWTISVLSTIAQVGVYIAFIFIIICLLSIVIDESFSRKMQRLALGLTGITLLFILYPIFVGVPTFYYGIP